MEILILLPFVFIITVIARLIIDSNNNLELKKSLKSLKEKVELLESRMVSGVKVESKTSQISMNAETQQELSVDNNTPSQITESVQSETKESHSQIKQETVFSSFWLWLQTNFLMKVGALFIILAVSWFVGYAFVNNWIDPAGRIILGLVFAACFIVWGSYQIYRQNAVVGQVIVLVGTTSALVSIWSAGNLFGFINYYTTLVALFLVVALTAALAILLKAKPLAIASTVLASLIPYQGLNMTTEGLDFLLAYGLLLNVVAIGVLAFRRWRVVFTISLLTALAYSPSLLNVNDNLRYIYLGSFFVLLYLTQVLAIFSDKKVIFMDYINTSLISLISIVCVVNYVNRDIVPYVFFGLALFSILVSTGFHIITKLKNFFEIHFYSALVFIGAGIAYAFNFDTFPVFILIFFELLLAQCVLGYLFSKPKQVQIVGIFQLSAFFLNITNNFYLFSFSQDYQLTIIAILVIIFGLNSFVASNLNSKLAVKEENFVGIVTGYISLLCSVSFIWILFEKLVSDSFFAHGISLVIFTIFGISLLYYSRFRQNKNWNYAGLVLIVGVILRLILVEIALMPTEIRILTFVVIGLLLLLTAFTTRKKKS